MATPSISISISGSNSDWTPSSVTGTGRTVAPRVRRAGRRPARPGGDPIEHRASQCVAYYDNGIANPDLYRVRPDALLTAFGADRDAAAGAVAAAVQRR